MRNVAVLNHHVGTVGREVEAVVYFDDDKAKVSWMGSNVHVSRFTILLIVDKGA